MVAAVERSRVRPIEVTDGAREIGPRRLQQQVVMVAHEDPRVADHVVLLHHGGQGVDKALSVAIVANNGFALVRGGV